MRKKVVVSSAAKKDIARLKAYIKQELKMPQTAANYIKALNAVVHRLSFYADAVGENEYIQKRFGTNARHIIFKKMAIIFFVENELIYIKRIIPSSLIR